TTGTGFLERPFQARLSQRLQIFLHQWNEEWCLRAVLRFLRECQARVLLTSVPQLLLSPGSFAICFKQECNRMP
ncbi:hypothetical protein Ancab_014164, partial [Ancistrocladus abbreviatus]